LRLLRHITAVFFIVIAALGVLIGRVLVLRGLRIVVWVELVRRRVAAPVVVRHWLLFKATPLIVE
jgi:hypothetical protein